MASTTESLHPKLRSLQLYPLVRGGRRYVWLRDPLHLTGKDVLVPQQFVPLLALCDGTRDSSALSASLAVRHGIRMSTATIEQFLEALDDALLLDNSNFREVQSRLLLEYREADFRKPALAGESYPDDPSALRAWLDQYLAETCETEANVVGGRGLVTPHIDYTRGGGVYARVWKRAAVFVREANLVVILGTDHVGSGGAVTLTRQDYATPFGVLPTKTELVDALAREVGEEDAFAEELHHRNEHSIELAAVWLHYVRDGQPCELLPVLCGSYHPYIQGESDIAEDRRVNGLVRILREAVADSNVVVVAAADMSHVGPAFQGPAVGAMERAQIRAVDGELTDRICEGDADGFLDAVKRTGDRTNVCGIPPIYLALRSLSPVRGELVAYDMFPADAQNSSVVSACGILFE